MSLIGVGLSEVEHQALAPGSRHADAHHAEEGTVDVVERGIAMLGLPFPALDGTSAALARPASDRIVMSALPQSA